MPETVDLLQQSAERLFREHVPHAAVLSAETGHWPERLWNAIDQAGFAAALVLEEGGLRVGLNEAGAILRAAGRYAAPVPIAETMLGTWLLAQAGLTSIDGPLTIAPVRTSDTLRLEAHTGGWRLTGKAHRIPWSSAAHAVVVMASGPQGRPMIAIVPSTGLHRGADSNLAGEPRDEVTFENRVPEEAVAAAPAEFGLQAMLAFGAALRTAQMAGALQRILELTVTYAQERVQFGRPIGKFQAVQQNLAVLAGQAAAAGAAADIAAEGVQNGFDLFAIGAGKARSGEAASIGAAIAHQVHGAIGFTREYPLASYTRRLWSWRDEFGSEAEWNRTVGARLASIGPDALWSVITATRASR